MEVRFKISEKYLVLAAYTLQLASDGDEEDIVDIARKCKDTVVELDFKDFEGAEASKLSLALAMYAIAKAIDQLDEKNMSVKSGTLTDKLRKKQDDKRSERCC